MNDTISEVLQFAKENDVKFIHLAFCDLFGTQKSISIMPGELPRAFQYGISFDASAIQGFGTVECSDLFLLPDSSSVSILPWRSPYEQVMKMYCDIKRPDGSDFTADSRYLLKQAVKRCADLGYICKIGTEGEFYLFQTDAEGNPTTIPYDQAGYGDTPPLDKGENLRREICLTLEDMDIRPETSHHERGPGQNEVDFRYSDALSAADNFLSFKSVVKSVAAQNGLYASFLPKPILTRSGNGLHINLSLAKGGKNLFEMAPGHSQSAESFIAGILEHVGEMTAFLNPLTNSYRRLGAFEAPGYITWSHQNRSQLIRIPASAGEYNRMELRSADSACNPYLAFILLIHAGLDGIEKGLPLTEPCNQNLYEAAAYVKEHDISPLPRSLAEALDTAEQSGFVKKVLPESVRSAYFTEKRKEWEACRQAEDSHQYEMNTFFHLI